MSEYLLDYTFRKVYHIADLHIRLHHRHDEYKEVFDRLYDDLSSKVSPNKNDALLVIAGDVLHAYNDLSPELIEVMMRMLQKLTSVLPVIMIAGNHDANLGNMNRTDGLTPFDSMGIYPNLYYLKHTGYYTFGNVTFVVNSLLDKEPWIDGKPDNSTIHIGLYHGALYQAQTPTGYSVDDQSITTSLFENCDMVMLGDIHHYQQVGKQSSTRGAGPIVYSGSLIQQNFGETPWYHGYVEWDVETRTYAHIEVPNDYGYCTFVIEDGKLPSVCEFCKKHPDMRAKHCLKTLYIPPKPRLRIGTVRTQPSEYEELVNELRKSYDIQSIVRLPMAQNANIKNSTHTHASAQITDMKFQKELITKYLERYKEITAKDIHHILQINEQFNASLEADKTLALGSEWTPLYLEWSNLFCYGENNWINFSDWQGWVGFIQPNRIGKTSIWDIILFCLFDTTTRGKVSKIQRTGSTFYEYRFRFRWNNATYEVSQRGGNKKRPKALHMIHSDGNRIAEDKCRDRLKFMFGDIRSLLSTTFRLQKTPDTYFLNKTEKDRKRFISNLLNLDLLNKLFDLGKKAHRNYTNELKALESEFKHCISATGFDDVDQLVKELKHMATTLDDHHAKEKGLAKELKALVDRLDSLAPRLPIAIAPDRWESIRQAHDHLERQIQRSSYDETAFPEEERDATRTREQEARIQVSELQDQLVHKTSLLRPEEPKADRTKILARQAEIQQELDALIQQKDALLSNKSMDVDVVKTFCAWYDDMENRKATLQHELEDKKRSIHDILASSELPAMDQLIDNDEYLTVLEQVEQWERDRDNSWTEQSDTWTRYESAQQMDISKIQDKMQDNHIVIESCRSRGVDKTAADKCTQDRVDHETSIRTMELEFRKLERSIAQVTPGTANLRTWYYDSFQELETVKKQVDTAKTMEQMSFDDQCGCCKSNMKLCADNSYVQHLTTFNTIKERIEDECIDYLSADWENALPTIETWESHVADKKDVERKLDDERRTVSRLAEDEKVVLLDQTKMKRCEEENTALNKTLSSLTTDFDERKLEWERTKEGDTFRSHTRQRVLLKKLCQNAQRVVDGRRKIDQDCDQHPRWKERHALLDQRAALSACQQVDALSAKIDLKRRDLGDSDKQLQNIVVCENNATIRHDISALKKDKVAVDADIRQINDWFKSCAQHDRARLDFVALTKDLEHARQELQQIRVSKDNQLKNRELEQHEASLRVKHAEQQEQMNRTKEGILQTTVRYESIEKIVQRLKDLQLSNLDMKDKERCMKYYKLAMDEDGVRQSIIERTLDTLVYQTNYLLSGIVDFHLNFEMAQDNLNIYIVDKEKRDVSLASGFEGFVIDLALRVGFQSICHGSLSNMCIIDEGWSSISSGNMESVRQVLDVVATRFQWIAMVTHVDSLKTYVNKEVVISQTDHVSCLQHGNRMR